MSVRGVGSTASPLHRGPEKSSPISSGITQCSSATNAGQSVAETALTSSGKSSAVIALDPDNSAARSFGVWEVGTLIGRNAKTASRVSECMTGGPYTGPAYASVASYVVLRSMYVNVRTPVTRKAPPPVGTTCFDLKLITV